MKTTQFIKEIKALPTLREKQLFYLNDVVSHYNTQNRCVNGLSCQYEPYNENTEGCAIGRRIPAKLRPILDNVAWGDSSVSELEVFTQLPHWMKVLGTDFLQNIQNLHDNRGGMDYWDEDGINESGLEELERIKRKFNLA